MTNLVLQIVLVLKGNTFYIFDKKKKGNKIKYNFIITSFFSSDGIELKQSVCQWRKFVYNGFRLKGTVRASWRTHLNKKDVLLRNMHRCLFFFFTFHSFIWARKRWLEKKTLTNTILLPSIKIRSQRKKRFGFLCSRWKDEKNTLPQFRTYGHIGQRTRL